MNREIDQRNRTESPETDPRTYANLISDKEGKSMEESINFSISSTRITC